MPQWRLGSNVGLGRTLKTQLTGNGDPLASSTTWAYGADDGECFFVARRRRMREGWSYSQYGRLYSWAAVNDDRGLCPTGWHVPSDSEWMDLEMALGMDAAEATGTGFREPIKVPNSNPPTATIKVAHPIPAGSQACPEASGPPLPSTTVRVTWKLVDVLTRRSWRLPQVHLLRHRPNFLRHPRSGIRLVRSLHPRFRVTCRHETHLTLAALVFATSCFGQVPDYVPTEGLVGCQ